MSAFVVSKTHIDAMVTAGVRFGEPGRSRLQGSHPVRWFAPGMEEEEGAYEEGQAWGPRACEIAEKYRREITLDTAEQTGQMLWAENRRSVNHRYAEEEWEEVYQFEELGNEVDPITVLNAISCYEYQSCEHPDWEKSEAFAYCRALKDRCISILTQNDDTWEINDPEIFGTRFHRIRIA